MQRLLIAANLNLDMPLIGYSAQARSQRRQESLACFSNLAREAVAQRVDGVIIAGNLFFTPYPSPAAWQAVKEGADILGSAGIPLLLLAGENDQGPFYNKPLLPSVPVLNKGGMAQFLDTIHVVVGEEMPFSSGILRWMGPSNPVPAKGSLTIAAGTHWSHDNPGLLNPGSPLKLNFDEPDEPAVTIVSWDEGPQAVEALPLPDRVFATVRWDIEERGVDLSAYLEERQDPELALRLLVFGKLDETLPLESWKERFGGGYFHLVFQDETDFIPGNGASPLANDAFDQSIKALLNDPNMANKKTTLVRAWELGQSALEGGEKRAD